MNIYEIVAVVVGIMFCAILVWYANRPLYVALECRICKYRNEHGIGWKEDGSENACPYCDGSGVKVYAMKIGPDEAGKYFDNLLWMTYKKPKCVKLSEVKP